MTSGIAVDKSEMAEPLAVVGGSKFTPSIKRMLNRHAGEDELRAALEADGATFLMQDALAKVRDGLTTVEEVLRVIRTEKDERLPRSHRLGTSRRTPRKSPRPKTSPKPAA